MAADERGTPDPAPETEPTRRPDLTTRLARSATGALMLGIGGTLQEIYEGKPKQEIAIVEEAPDDEPLPDDDLWIEFDPDDPSRTIVHLRGRHDAP